MTRRGATRLFLSGLSNAKRHGRMGDAVFEQSRFSTPVMMKRADAAEVYQRLLVRIEEGVGQRLFQTQSADTAGTTILTCNIIYNGYVDRRIAGEIIVRGRDEAARRITT